MAADTGAPPVASPRGSSSSSSDVRRPKTRLKNERRGPPPLKCSTILSRRRRGILTSYAPLPGPANAQRQSIAYTSSYKLQIVTSYHTFAVQFWEAAAMRNSARRDGRQQGCARAGVRACAGAPHGARQSLFPACTPGKGTVRRHSSSLSCRRRFARCAYDKALIAYFLKPLFRRWHQNRLFLLPLPWEGQESRCGRATASALPCRI